MRLNSLALVDIGVASQLFLRAPVHFLPSDGSFVHWGNLHVWFRFRPHLLPLPPTASAWYVWRCTAEGGEKRM